MTAGSSTRTPISTVDFLWDIHLLTDFLIHLLPLLPDGNNTLIAVEKLIRTVNAVAASVLFYFSQPACQSRNPPFLKLIVKIFQNHIVDIGSCVTNGSVEKIQAVLHTDLLELRSCQE